MAIVVENDSNSKDRFKVKCNCCGRELSYSRADVKLHRRWPNGFIYCPGCKTPIGHIEDNLVERGTEREKQSVQNLSLDSLNKSLKILNKRATLFTVLASCLLFLGGMLLAFLILKITSVGNRDSEMFYSYFMIIPILLLLSGIPFIPLAIVNWVLASKQESLIKTKKKYEKNSN